MKRRPTYLEAGQRMRFGRPVGKRVGDFEPLPEPATVPDFELGSWRVRPAVGRMTRADRLVALDGPTLRCVLALHAAPPGGVPRALLAALVFGQGVPDDRLRRCLSFLRRVFAEDGSVRIENAPGDCFCLWTGPPVPGRGLRGSESVQLSEPIDAVADWIERPRRRWIPLTAAAALVASLVFGLMHLLGGPGHVLSHRVRTVRPFASEPGLKTSPSFAPDGRQVVYAWAQPGGSAHLYVRAVPGGAPRPLTSGDGEDLYPVWSSGGGLIGYVHLGAGGCELMTILADGSNRRPVGRCDASVAGVMAFSRGGRALTYPNRTSELLPSQIVTLDLNTGALSGVTNPVVGMPGDTRPTLTPTSRRLAFVRTRSPGIADVALADRGVGEVVRVTHDYAPINGLAWEPDSRTLLVASARGGRSRLWAVPADGGTPRFVIGGPGELSSPTFSPDAHEVIYERRHRALRLASVTIGDERTSALPLPVATGEDRAPSLSPDGRRVAFVSDRSGNDELWIADADGSHARQLTHEKAEWVAAPHWAHDGRSLIVAAGVRGESDLYTVDADSGARRALTTDHLSGEPSLSADGRTLYYASRSGPDAMPQLHRRTWPTFVGDVTLTSDGGTRAAESADGKHLYYTRPDRPGLWRRGLTPDSDAVLVSADLAAEHAGDWLVVPGGVMFILNPPGEAPVLAFYAEDAEAISRLCGLPNAAPGAGLAVSADRQRAVYVEQTAVSVDLEIAELD